MPSVDEELLTETGTAAAREALTANYAWFLHIKPIAEFEKIKEEGLKPRSQGRQPPEIVTQALRGRVANVEEIICLRPINTWDTTPRRGKIMFAMAINRSALPSTITLDWTYDLNMGMADIIKRDTPTMANELIFCEVVRRRGSIAIYEAVPRELLRVWTRGQPFDDPSNWPRLIDTNISDIEQLK